MLSSALLLLNLLNYALVEIVGNQNPFLLRKGYSIFMPCKDNASMGAQQTKQWSWSMNSKAIPSSAIDIVSCMKSVSLFASELQLCPHFILSSVQILLTFPAAN